MGKNLKIKLLSILLAILLWFYVTEIQTLDTTRTIADIPITITNMQTLLDKELTFIEPESIVTAIKIKGTKDIVRNLSKDNFEVTADVKNIGVKGKEEVTLKVNMVNVSGLEIVSLSPAKLELEIENLVKVEKPISVKFKGEKATEYIFDTSNINPEIATIKGPESIINTIADVNVNLEINAVSDIDNVTFKDFCILDQLGDDITSNKSLIFDSTPIQIEYTVLKSKIVPIETSIVGQPANGYTITNKTITPAQVVIIGKEAEIMTIDKVYTKPIYISGAKETQVVSIGLETQNAIKRFVYTSDNSTIVNEVSANIEITKK